LKEISYRGKKLGHIRRTSKRYVPESGKTFYHAGGKTVKKIYDAPALIFFQ